MEISRIQIDRVQLLFGDPDSRLVTVRVEFGLHAQTSRCRRIGNQLDNYFTTDQWLSTPVGRNLTEQAMLNLIPFAGSGRKVADADHQAQFISQMLQRNLPESASAAITAATISGDQQFTRVRVQGVPQLVPPSPNRFDRKLGGIVINSYAHPSKVGRQIVDAVRDRFPQLFIGKVVNAHGLWVSFRTPFPPVVFEVSDQLFLFGVHRNDGLVSRLKGRNFRGNVFKLGVAIRC